MWLHRGCPTDTLIWLALIRDLHLHGYKKQPTWLWSIRNDDCLLEMNSGLPWQCFAEPIIHHNLFPLRIYIISLIVSNVKITTAVRGFCHLNVNICRFGAVAKTTDSVVFLGTDIWDHRRQPSQILMTATKLHPCHFFCTAANQDTFREGGEEPVYRVTECLKRFVM